MADSQPIISTVSYKTIPELSTYRFGDDGSVWGSTRPTTGSMQSDGWSRLKLYKNKFGYITARLSTNGKGRQYKVHRLVLMAFIGPCPAGMVACHNDGDRTNNRLTNLRWDTLTNNQADALRHGTRAMGSRQGLAKLDEAAVAIIRTRAGNGERPIDLAKEFGVTYQCMRSIVSRRTWKHVG